MMRAHVLAVVVGVVVAVQAAPARAQYFNMYNRGYGYGGFGNNYVLPDPYSGNLMGSASVINASGQYMLQTQQAFQMREQYRQSKIDTKRKAFDEYLYERANTPTHEEERQRSQMQEFQRSRNDPPVTEIWSGKALNDLLLDIQQHMGSNVYAQSVPVNPDSLKHINVSSGSSAGNAGILRDGGKLRWPLALTDSAYDKDRKQLEKLIPAAIEQAKAGEVEGTMQRDLLNAVGNITRRLKANIADIPSNQYVSAKRYIGQVEEAVKILQDPNVANYFDKWRPRGGSVSEVVQQMTSNGLKFAPATHGDEPYYTSLHRAMANFDVALNQSSMQSTGTASARVTPSPRK